MQQRRYRIAGVPLGTSKKVTVRLQSSGDGLEVQMREDGLFHRWGPFLLGDRPGHSYIENTPQAIADAWAEIENFGLMTRID